MAQDHFTYGIAPCPKCGHLTRSAKTLEARAPGTRVRVTGGFCRGVCAKKPSMSKSRALRPEDRAARDAGTLQAWEQFLEARRARGVPAEGLSR